MGVYQVRALLVLGMLAMVQPAIAAPVIYACQIVQRAGAGEPTNDVDQVIIDTDNPTVDMRVARTMGTANEMQWVYRTENLPGDTLIMKLNNGAILGAGIRGTAAVSFSLTGSVFMLTYMEGLSISMQTWTCGR